MNSDELYIKLSQEVHRHFGLDFKRQQWKSLGAYLERAAKEIKRDPSLPMVLDWVSKEKLTQAEHDVLTKNLTIGETYFFREKAAFGLLTEQVVKPAMQSSLIRPTRLRIWSAGCSSGEEPYSIAITLKEALPDFSDWDIKILATDLNPYALEKARKGWYRTWSFRDTSTEIRDKYFRKKGEGYQIDASIQAMVEFRQLNLIEDDYYKVIPHPACFDMVFCRNVLMYFSPDLIRKVAGRFRDALKENGWFVTSQVELNDTYFSVFARRQHGSGLFYQKSTVKTVPDLLSVFIPAKSSTLRRSLGGQPPAPPESPNKSEPGLLAKGMRLVRELSSSEKTTRAEQGNIRKADAGRRVDQAKADEAPLHAAHKNAAKPKITAPQEEAIAQALANTGRYKEAELKLQEMLRSDGENIKLLLLFASVLTEQGKLAEADAQLVKVLYLEPDDLPALFARSRLLKQLGKTELSRKHLSRLLYLLDSKQDADTITVLDDLNVGMLRKLALAELS